VHEALSYICVRRQESENAARNAEELQRAAEEQARPIKKIEAATKKKIEAATLKSCSARAGASYNKKGCY
jgi:hypothetical protein